MLKERDFDVNRATYFKVVFTTYRPTMRCPAARKTGRPWQDHQLIKSGIGEVHILAEGMSQAINRFREWYGPQGTFTIHPSDGTPAFTDGV